MTAKLAFVDKTNTVTMVLNTDESNVAIFTGSTHIIDVSTNNEIINVGWNYDETTGEFSLPPTPSTEAIPTN
jgi:hypothetical protein